MRHRVQGRKLGLPSDQRMALLKGLVKQMVRYGYVVTTETRAKEVRPILEKLVTLAREDSLHHRRMSEKWLATETPRRAVRKPQNFNQLSPNHKAKVTEKIKARKPVATNNATSDYVHHLFTSIAPKFIDRPGGYTRMFKLGFRRGDAAPIVRLEFALDE